MQYSADLSLLNALDAPFTRLSMDEATAEYLLNSEAARHGALITWLHRAMRGFLSDFDINGYLGTYPMHVLSSDQWETLLGDRRGRLLDVGAGRGDATLALASRFDQVVVTETSHAMAKRLRKQGYECLEEDISQREDLYESFDAVSLLNVLDRCDKPLSLLGSARRALKPNGLLIIALVLPYHAFVYDRGSPRAPHERLPIAAKEWELAAVQFISTCLIPLGLEIVTLSRAPYLSGGDTRKALYELDDLIVIARAKGNVALVG